MFCGRPALLADLQASRPDCPTVLPPTPQSDVLKPLAPPTIQEEIEQRRPFHSLQAEVAVSILRTAALIDRHFASIVARAGITTQQYNVLRILRGAGDDGLPTLVIRDRMIHEAPGITRLPPSYPLPVS